MSLDDTKSTGPSSVPIKLLKIISDPILFPPSDIFNTSFNEGTFPDKAKIAKLIPIHKKGSTAEVNNYRPISLHSTFSKITEKLMAIRPTEFLNLHETIYPKQFGLRLGLSTTNSLFDIVENIKKTVENKKYGCGVFIDLKKAFETVNHSILLQKLKNYGIRNQSLMV